MRRQGPKVRKVCWLVRIGPNFFCRLAASLRVIFERYIAKKRDSNFALLRSEEAHAQEGTQSEKK